MKWLWSALSLALLASTGFAQGPVQGTQSAPIAVLGAPTAAVTVAQAAPAPATLPGTPAAPAATLPGAPVMPAAAPVLNEIDLTVPDHTRPNLFAGTAFQGSQGGLLTGNQNFNNFIGFMSNPLFAIDPRAVTELYPLFGSSWTSSFPRLPSADIQLYGAGLTLALSDRLAVGLNQGGYAVAHIHPNANLDPVRVLFNLDPRTERDGFLNLGGFAQYTLIADVPNQFLLTAGLHWDAPTGSEAVFQGHNPVHLAPYATVGKEFGEFHVLATTGYQFPLESGDTNTQLFYGTVHLDRRLFCWLYPLVECSWVAHTSHVNLDQLNLPDFFDFGNFEGTGNIVTLSVGANAVLIPHRLEVGGVYTTTLYSQNNFNLNGFLLKMTYRF
jgi:hypothetical protein